VGDGSHVFGKKFLCEKGNIRCCLDATASSFVAKVEGEVFAHFHTVVVKSHINIQN
jgi:hypothetical protein